MQANHWLNSLAPAAPYCGVVLGLINIGLVVLLVRANRIFRDELIAVDRLVSEYVRFRDLLHSARKPEGGISGLRLMGDEAFREAWLNFNQQLDTTRSRYRERAGRLRTWSITGAVAVVVVGGLAGAGTAQAGPDVLRLLPLLGALVATSGLWTALLIQLRQNGRLMMERTSGSHLLAPWPSDGGTQDRQLSLLGKFLPVEVGPPSEEALPEVRPSA